MGKERSVIVGLLVAFIGLVGASTFVLDWFVVRVPALTGLSVDQLSIDLHGAHACAIGGPCVSVPLKGAGLYSTLAPLTLWGSVLFGVLVAFQGVTRLLSGYASQPLSARGYQAGAALIGSALLTGYLFGPDVGSSGGAFGLTVSIERTWAPLVLVLGHAVGIAVCYYALKDDGVEVAAAQSLVRRPPATATPVPVPTPAPPEPPAEVRAQVEYALVAADLTVAGIDARRDDGEGVLVLWRDVIGVVARRLPTELGGAPFVDVVSIPGATVRVLPWTRLTGERLDGEGEPRARALVALVRARCPDAELDARTRGFVDEQQGAAQLPDGAALAAHDERLR